jgi:hypothetical protein
VLGFFPPCRILSVRSESALNEIVSAYSSINEEGNLLAVILVCRDLNNDQPVSVFWENYGTKANSATYYRLSNLPVGDRG